MIDGCVTHTAPLPQNPRTAEYAVWDDTDADAEPGSKSLRFCIVFSCRVIIDDRFGRGPFMQGGTSSSCGISAAA
jgi:hypothetical protein